MNITIVHLVCLFFFFNVVAVECFAVNTTSEKYLKYVMFSFYTCSLNSSFQNCTKGTVDVLTCESRDTPLIKHVMKKLYLVNILNSKIFNVIIKTYSNS